MTYFEFLCTEKASGNLKKWLLLGAPSQLPKWMEIYFYHLQNSDLSQEQLAADLNTSSSTVQRALSFMNQLFT